jgi:FkbM family methyltransferase
MLEPWLVPFVRTQGDVFVDVGANIGTWTRWLAASFQSVHAIEPNPAALPELKANLPANVTVHELGAWDAERTITFSRFTESVHLTAYFHEAGINTGPKRGEIQIACRPIDALAISGRVDFLKCDTEGAELECLRGAQGIIARDRPQLLVECHSRQNFAALTQLLQEWRYSVTVIRHPGYEPNSEHWHAHCWIEGRPQGD